MSAPRASLRLVLLATSLVAFAPAVRAEDAAPPANVPVPAATPSAVSRLTPEELEILRRRFPDFDAREAAVREKIATNVIRLRTLSPEERKRLVERLHRVEGDGGPGAAAAAERLGQIDKMGRASFREGALRMRAVAIAVVGALSPERRAALTPDATGGGASATSIGVNERLQLDVCIASLWKRRVVEGLAAKPPTDAEPLAGAGTPAAARFVAARDRVRNAGGATAPEADRRAFAREYAEDRVAAARRGVDAPTTPGTGATSAPARSNDERLAAFGRALAQAFPATIEAVATELGAAVDGGRPALKKFCDDAMPERLSERARTLVELVLFLERARNVVTGDVLAKLCDLEIAALRELKVPEAELARFLPGGEEIPRKLVLAAFARRLKSGDRAGPHAGWKFGGGRRDK